jgi:hypothetical protein
MADICMVKVIMMLKAHCCCCCCCPGLVGATTQPFLMVWCTRASGVMSHSSCMARQGRSLPWCLHLMPCWASNTKGDGECGTYSGLLLRVRGTYAEILGCKWIASSVCTACAAQEASKCACSASGVKHHEVGEGHAQGVSMWLICCCCCNCCYCMLCVPVGCSGT